MPLTTKEAAELLNITEDVLLQWVKERKLPTYRSGNTARFHKAELLEWATINKVEVSNQMFVESEPPKVELPELQDALAKGGIFYDIPGKTKESALRSVASILPLPEAVDQDFLLEVILAREALGTTAIGDGIAIPHVRDPLVLRIPTSLVTLCFLENPVGFGALDHKPVFALFTIVTPTIQAHLHLLSRLAFALRDKDFKALIHQQAGPKEILADARRVNDKLLALKAQAKGA